MESGPASDGEEAIAELEGARDRHDWGAERETKLGEKALEPEGP